MAKETKSTDPATPSKPTFKNAVTGGVVEVRPEAVSALAFNDDLTTSLVVGGSTFLVISTLDEVKAAIGW